MTTTVPQADFATAAGVEELEERNRLAIFWEKRQRGLLGLLGIALVLGSWELCADLKIVNPVFSSKPSLIAVSLKEYLDGGGGLHAIQASATEFGIGFALALGAGLVLGLAIGWWKFLDYLFDPLINIGYAVPRIALVPLFVVWFGIGLNSKVAIIFLSAIFPILLNTITGVKTTDASLIRVARSFKASSLQLFRTVVLPGALPQIVTGIRLGIGLGLVGMIVGELVSSTQGLGYTIETAGNNFQMGLMFAAVGIVSAAGVTLSQLIRVFEKRLDRWRPQTGA